MPFTGLNKVVSMFLVGSLAIGWLIVVSWESFLLALGKVKDSQDAVIALGSILALASVGAAGVLVDGLSDLTLRRLIKLGTRRRWVSFALGQGRLYDSMVSWRDWFARTSHAHRVRAGQPERAPHPEMGSYQLAAGIFQKEAAPHHFEWVISHYATYYLASSTGLVGVLYLVPLVQHFRSGDLSFVELIGALTVLLTLVYSACSLAADRYLYTYVATFRFATLWLNDQTPKAEEP